MASPCSNCQHRTQAQNCAKDLELAQGVVWCSGITECVDVAPRGENGTSRASVIAAHLITLRRLDSWGQRNYISNVSRAEGDDAAQELRRAFMADVEKRAAR